MSSVRSSTELDRCGSRQNHHAASVCLVHTPNRNRSQGGISQHQVMAGCPFLSEVVSGVQFVHRPALMHNCSATKERRAPSGRGRAEEAHRGRAAPPSAARRSPTRRCCRTASRATRRPGNSPRSRGATSAPRSGPTIRSYPAAPCRPLSSSLQCRRGCNTMNESPGNANKTNSVRYAQGLPLELF